MKLAALLAVIVQLLASCVPPTPSGPPNAQMPTTYRGLAATGSSLGSVPWRKLYDDPVLQDLIVRALRRNFNVELAYTAILEAAANLGITAANQSVFVNGAISAPYEVITGGNKPGSVPNTQFSPEAGIDASYQVDLFGKLASATGAARDQLLATDAAKDTVLATVVSQVATAYFQLLELDEVMAFTQDAATSRAEGVRLMRQRVEGGVSSMQDLRQAQQALLEVTQNIPTLRQDLAQTENALSVLVGDYPHPIVRGLPLNAQVAMPVIPPAGVSGELLERRPDIRQAEFTIAAAAGNVDVAQKLLYPQITLGASAVVAGQQSSGLYPNLPLLLATFAKVNGLFFGPLGIFEVLPQLLQPIFNGGEIRSQIHLAQADQQQAVISYLQTVDDAFEEVSNDIVSYNQSRARTVQLGLYLAASLDSVRLAKERYEAGYTSYLEVLDSLTRSYQAQTDFAQARLNERLALVQLYLALGGGWQS
jgi:multidrug efflux system outer membrane protein